MLSLFPFILFLPFLLSTLILFPLLASLCSFQPYTFLPFFLQSITLPFLPPLLTSSFFLHSSPLLLNYFFSHFIHFIYYSDFLSSLLFVKFSVLSLQVLFISFFFAFNSLFCKLLFFSSFLFHLASRFAPQDLLFTFLCLFIFSKLPCTLSSVTLLRFFLSFLFCLSCPPSPLIMSVYHPFSSLTQSSVSRLFPSNYHVSALCLRCLPLHLVLCFIILFS